MNPPRDRAPPAYGSASLGLCYGPGAAEVALVPTETHGVDWCGGKGVRSISKSI